MNLNRENINETVARIVANRGVSADAVIPILQDIQQEFRYLPEDALRRVCEVTEITPAAITGVSSFYSQFRHQRSGEHLVRVCTGTACHVKGALFVYDALRREMKLKEFEHTDALGIFTIEKVACLGCCTLAPVVKIDDITFGHVTPEHAGDILKDFLKRKKTEPPEPVADRKAGPVSQGEIRIGLGSCCIASGSSDVRTELEQTLARTGIQVTVKQVGCVGICNQVPILEIIREGREPAFYARIRPEEVEKVVLKHFRPVRLLDRFRTGFTSLFEKAVDYGEPTSFIRYDAEQRDTPLTSFLGPQINIATEFRGEIRPCDIAEYRKNGGFEALKRCLVTMTPEEVVEEITKSGLRGRGGAGFPTGKKWRMVMEERGKEKYVICNGDEGDPGAFMDRMLLESYPFRIIEGVLIAGYATGADQGLFYIRAEYALATQRIREALEICRAGGMIGDHILGTGFSFDLRIFEGAGAFVCGEETALIASVEGKRGLPRLRPPYPAKSGFRNRPTLINNTETFSLVPWIIRNGAAAFNDIGTGGSKGTKVFALAGKVKRGGLIEVTMGITIRRIVEEIGGGIAGERKFKAVQIGGPSGGCLPASLADLPVDFEALTGAGAMMGSGGLIVLDETDCMVDLAYYFLSFTQSQSCGRCTFCRIGTRRMLELLDKIRTGNGAEDDLVHLEQMANSIQRASLCGLGKTAPNPVLTTLKYFRGEYEKHIHGHCPSGKCTPLITYLIDDSCIGCTKCAQACPTDAIAFKPYEVHSIDQENCIKCDICRQVCPVNSVKVNS